MPLTQLLVDEIRGCGNEMSNAAKALDSGRMIRLAERAAKSATPVLIEGEPGTGGDSLARAIHECSDRRGRPFVRVHCGGLGEEAARILFQSDRASGVGALGKVLEANGGTLLLQGIEDLPPDAQALLLRAIQDGEVGASASRRGLRVDVRVIATSASNLMERVRHGRFREDLYYRLHVLPIAIPPLRARREAIPHLASLFLARFASDEGKAIAGLSHAAAALLMRYDWPGNARQLENALFRAVALADGCELTVTEFPQLAARVDGVGIEIPPVPAAPALQPVQDPPPDLRDPHVLRLVDDTGELRRLDELEAEIIRFALAHYGGHMSAISRRLGIGRSTLYRKLKELGLENVPSDAAA
jgi:DNA-binding NtrC family response regulator